MGGVPRGGAGESVLTFNLLLRICLCVRACVAVVVVVVISFWGVGVGLGQLKPLSWISWFGCALLA